jgi:hypothetical protein
MPLAGSAQPFNRQQPKKVGKNKFAHVANTKYGMGDNYGTGVKAKLGRMVEGVGQQKISNSKLKNPPKNLA